MIVDVSPVLLVGIALMVTLSCLIYAVLMGRQASIAKGELKTLQVHCAELSTRLEQHQSEADQQRDQAYHWQQQYQSLLRSHGQLEAQVGQVEQLQERLRIAAAELESSQHLAQQHALRVTRLEEERRAFEDKIQLLEQSEQRLQTQFENLANRIFEEKSQTLGRQNQASIDALLGPLRQQLEGFRNQVQQSYDSESKDRHALRDQILTLQKLNTQMSEEAINLTRALKGDNKQQGNWGEVVLERILEESGLQAGREYRTQVSGKNQHDQLIKPDVVVMLPKKRAVVIDSKVTLTAYERYFHAEDDASRAQALVEHGRSLRGHILGLAKKDYHTLHSIQTLDYVLLFVPIEAAFHSALEADPSLINLALERNILLVSPTNLLVALRTIENLWRSEHQQQNAVVIAERAGKLYDKFCLFVDDLKRVGEQLNRAQDSYQGAMNKLSSGRGNLVRQAEQLRELHIPATKQLDESVVMQMHDESLSRPELGGTIATSTLPE
jgi:DNA recombination protein RmuC